MGVGLNDNNAILNSVDVVVEVGVELGNYSNYLKMSGFSSRNVRYPRYQDTDLLQVWV